MLNHKPIPLEEVNRVLGYGGTKVKNVTVVVYDGEEVDVVGSFRDEYQYGTYVPSVDRPVTVLTGGSIYSGMFFRDTKNQRDIPPFAFLPTILDEPRFTEAYRKNISKTIAEMDPFFLNKKHYKEMMYVPLYEKDYGKKWAIVEI